MTDHLPSKERDNGLCYEHEHPPGGMSTTVWKKSSCPFCQLAAARRTAEHWKAEHLAGNREIERLTQSLATANANHERFEREWYLRGDEIERLRTALTGVSTCSTCEACRGAARLALGDQS